MFKGLFSIYLFLFISINAQAKLKSDSGIWDKSYDEVIQDVIEISIDFPKQTELVEIGKTYQNRTIYGLILKNKNQNSTKHLITITGATHGNEYLNIVDRLPRQFLSYGEGPFKRYLDQDGAILFVPIVNPDGYDKRYRRNSLNNDLNRDFPNSELGLTGLFNKETKALVNWIDNYINEHSPNYLVAVDYHCCHGSLLYPWSWTSERMSDEDLADHIFIGDLMKQNFDGYIHGITGEVLGYFPRGTSKDYWYQKYSAKSFTFEGKRYVEQNKLQNHLNWWGQIIENFDRF